MLSSANFPSLVMKHHGARKRPCSGIPKSVRRVYSHGPARQHPVSSLLHRRAALARRTAAPLRCTTHEVFHCYGWLCAVYASNLGNEGCWSIGINCSRVTLVPRRRWMHGWAQVTLFLLGGVLEGGLRCLLFLRSGSDRGKWRWGKDRQTHR